MDGDGGNLARQRRWNKMNRINVNNECDKQCHHLNYIHTICVPVCPCVCVPLRFIVDLINFIHSIVIRTIAITLDQPLQFSLRDFDVEINFRTNTFQTKCPRMVVPMQSEARPLKPIPFFCSPFFFICPTNILSSNAMNQLINFELYNCTRSDYQFPSIPMAQIYVQRAAVSIDVNMAHFFLALLDFFFKSSTQLHCNVSKRRRS